MPHLVVRGPCKLSGTVAVSGAKNALLPLLAATLIVEGETVFEDCPDLSDVRDACEILSSFGADVRFEGRRIRVNTDGCGYCRIPDPLMRRMRASLIFVGAVLARFGSAECVMPGGCSIGERPVDLHLFALRALGAEADVADGRCSFSAKQLSGAEITLRYPSVGATENAIIAAVLADGVTVINGAAAEPEVADLCDYLNGCGARISGHGSDSIKIAGVSRLVGKRHTVMPDRIVAATFIAAAATTRSVLQLENVRERDIAPVVGAFLALGIDFSFSGRRLTVDARGPIVVRRSFVAAPHPGFPTDAAPLLAGVMCLSSGEGSIRDGVFENRFFCHREFNRLGADTRVSGNEIFIRGRERLRGAPIVAGDLRAAAALACLAVAAHGESRIGGVEHLERGYDCLHLQLKMLGADIERIS